jgi:Fusaric acid resistance protein-like
MSSTRQQLKTLVFDVALMVIAGFAPAILMGLLGWTDGVNVAILSGLAVFIACMGGTGWRTGLVISLPFALLAGLADWASFSPWLAALVLASAAFLRGYAAKAGMHDALIMTVIALGFIVASPVSQDTPIAPPLYVALVALVASLWATFVIFLLRNRLHVHQHTGLDSGRVLAYSLVLALLVGTATWFVVDLDLGHTGGWIILTIVVVFQPSLGDGFQKAVHRAAGTVFGFVIAVLVGAVVTSAGLLYLFGTVFLMVAFILMMQGRPYWLYATVLTPAIVLLESAGSTVDEVAEQRLGATLIGVAVTVLVMLALTPFAKHLSTPIEH